MKSNLISFTSGFALVFGILTGTYAYNEQPPQHSSYYTSTPAPQICECGEAVTKVVIQEMNRTVMVPEFVPYPKEFAKIVGEDYINVPRFINDREETILFEPEVQERKVRVVNVKYDWKEVRKRVPVYNRTTLQIDLYTLDRPTNHVNHRVEGVPTPVQETEVDFQDVDIEVTIYKENPTVLRPEEIVFEDYPKIVEEIVFQDVIEFVEKIEYRNVDVYAWQVELYDEIFYQKDVVERPGNLVEIDDVQITKKPVKIPLLKYAPNPNPILVHDPVEIVRVPVPYPEFHNQTYKMAVKLPKIIPVPVYQDVPVEVPEYYKGVCEFPRKSQEIPSFLPPMCSCTPSCNPCPICPTEHEDGKHQREHGLIHPGDPRQYPGHRNQNQNQNHIQNQQQHQNQNHHQPQNQHQQNHHQQNQHQQQHQQHQQQNHNQYQHQAQAQGQHLSHPSGNQYNVHRLQPSPVSSQQYIFNTIPGIPPVNPIPVPGPGPLLQFSQYRQSRQSNPAPEKKRSRRWTKYMKKNHQHQRQHQNHPQQNQLLLQLETFGHNQAITVLHS